MIRKYRFSIIELLTVVLVILLLISLTIPIVLNLKMNARSAICKSNLRQLGILLTSYHSDHQGYLPYHSVKDIPKPTNGNNELYRNWNGHLLPYFSINLPDKYTRIAMVTSKECTRSSASQLGGPPNPPPTNVLKNGWVVIDEAYRNGGYQDLKSFICPEIHQNTFRINLSNNYNGVKIPRISFLTTDGPQAFSDKSGWDYGMDGGLPATYMANADFFGAEIDSNSNFINENSNRVDDINNISQKAFLVEGGKPHAVYYSLNIGGLTNGGDLSATFSLSKTNFDYHNLNFVHDNQNEFWVMDGASSRGARFPDYKKGQDFGMEMANKFNEQFAGKAYMASGSATGWWGWSGFVIVSNIYPNTETGTIFDSFFSTNPPGVSLLPFTAFIDEPNAYSYLTGEMNVLFGDGAVSKKSQTWLFNNARKIGSNGQD